MSEILVLLIEYLRRYGILILAPAIILQCNGIPLGANFMTMAIGAFSYAGEFDLIAMALAILACLVIGDTLSYLLWRSLGHKAMVRFPALAIRTRPRLDRAGQIMERYGWWSLLFTRFPLSSLGPPLNILAGLTSYRFSQYLAASLIGESFWTAFNLGIGFWFGDSWEDVIGVISDFSQLILLVVIFLILVYTIVQLIRRSRSPHPKDSENPEDPAHTSRISSVSVITQDIGSPDDQSHLQAPIPKRDGQYLSHPAEEL